MGKKNYNNVVKKQASNLDKAVNFLTFSLGNESWLYNLSVAAREIREQCKGDDWSVNIVDMEMPMENLRHLESGRLVGALKMFVSISMEGSGRAWDEETDCIKSLRFKVEVRETNQKDNEDCFQTGFHIDRIDEKDNPSEMHPLYHVHFLNDSKIEGVKVLTLDVPRLMHHPVDILLGVLLVYANYNQTGYKKLLADAHFMSLCRDSARHILGPYYRSLSLVPWIEGSISEYDKLLCPYLIT